MLIPLIKHMEWADALMWDAVLKLEGHEPRLHRLLYHLHFTQRAFLQVWQQKVSLDIPPEMSFKDYASIRNWARPYYSQAIALIERNQSADAPLPMPWQDQYARKFNRKADVATFGESVIQIAIHTSHHRGQVNARVRELGGEPPLVDYVVWVWVGKPDAVWEAAPAKPAVNL